MAEGQSWTWGGMIKGAVKIAGTMLAIVVFGGAVGIGYDAYMGSDTASNWLSKGVTQLAGTVGINLTGAPEAVGDAFSNIFSSDAAEEGKALAEGATDKATELANDAVYTAKGAATSFASTFTGWFNGAAETLGVNLQDLSIAELTGFDFTPLADPYSAIQSGSGELASATTELGNAITAAGETAINHYNSLGFDRLSDAVTALSNATGADLATAPEAVRNQLLDVLTNGQAINDVEHLAPALKETAFATLDQLNDSGITSGVQVDIQNNIIAATDGLLAAADKATGAIGEFTDIGNEIINPGMSTGTKAAIAAGGAGVAGAGYWRGKVSAEREQAQQQQGNPYL